MVQHPLDVVADARVHAGNALGAAEPGTEAHDSDYPPDGQGIWYKLPLFEYEQRKRDSPRILIVISVQTVYKVPT